MKEFLIYFFFEKIKRNFLFPLLRFSFCRATVEVRLISGNFYIFITVIRKGGETLVDLVCLNLVMVDKIKSRAQQI